MALESVFAIAPPLVGEVNKDTQIEGEKESKEDDDGDLTEPAEDLEDLEEGEILDDSEGEVTADVATKEDNSTQGAAENKELSDGQQEAADDSTEVADGKKKKKKKKRKGSITDEPIITLVKKKKIKYIDHDRIDDDEDDGWYDSYSSKYSRRDDRIDYSRALAEYRGSPYSSPEGSPRGPYDSPDHRRSPSPYSTPPSYGEDDYDDMEERGRRTRSSLRSRLGRKTSSRGGKQKKLSDKKSRLRGNINPRGRKRQMCKFFLENKCIKGSDCPFSHACSPVKRKELCKFYLNGYCGKGDACHFMHEEFPCKFYHTGSKCYSEKNCRFSHAPLTEEMSRLLDRYLESHKCDDDYNMKDDVDMEDRIPPNKHKRPSLLGSPPRHIKEAEETKRWQQEMQQMQQNKKGHFDRQFSSHKRMLNSPPRFSNSAPCNEDGRRPNFYVDTMKSPSKSPSKKSSPSKPVSFKLGQSSRLLKLSMESMKQSVLDGDSSSQEEWQKNRISMQPEEENTSTLDDDPTHVEEPEVDDNKGMEKRNSHSPELDSKDMGELNLTIGEINTTETLEAPNNSDQPTVVNQSQESGDGDLHASPDPEAPIVVPIPIAIPSHLPRKQRELFLRIQQHQKEAVSGESGTDGGDISEDHEAKTELEVKEERWYSSEETEEEDDDTADQPLTAVLKKLRAMPLPATTQPPPSSTPSPPIDIAKMLSSIRQQTGQPSVSNGSTFNNQQSDFKNFFQNILSGTVPPVASRPTVPFSTSQLPSTNNDNKDTISRVNSDLRFTINEQTLLPPLSSTVTATNRDPRMQNSDRPAMTRDPRLQSRSLDFRDPRITNTRDFQVPSLITSSAIPTSISGDHLGMQLQDRLREVPNIIQNKTAVIVDGGKGNGNVPYKLRAVSVSQPNYQSYVIAGQSDPKLLNDPRLRKHMKNPEMVHPHLTRQFPKDLAMLPVQMNNLPIENQHQVPPRLQDTQIPSGVSEPWQLPDIKLPPLRMADPRMTKVTMTDPRLARHQGNITPPHPNINETNWLPMPSSNAAPLISMVNPPPITTHLPRAITDPRLARLHHPIDPRRLRHVENTAHQEKNSHYPTLGARRQANISNDSSHDTVSPRDDLIRKPERTPPDFVHSANQNVTVSDSKDSVVSQQENNAENNDSEKPQKITSHNRKSSMDYASPLNTFDSNSTNNSGYNSYNRRPKPRIPTTTTTTNTPSVQVTIPDTLPSSSVTEPPSVSSQEPPELEQSAPFTSNEVPSAVADPTDEASSLKDMFKTIDPTASPFC